MPAALPWRVPASLAATQIIHWGSLFYAFSVLMPAMAAETGWAREMIVGAFTAGLLAEALAAIGIGMLLDRFGARRVMAAGSLAAAIGLLLAGGVRTPWQLYAAWAWIGAAMAATLYEAAFAAVTAAFGAAAARRGIAIVVFGGGLASTLFWPLTAWLTEAYGWRQACVALAAINALCALPHALLPSGRVRQAAPAGGAADPDLRQACRQPRFWGLAFVYAVAGLSIAALAVHLVPLIDERGAGASATLIASLLGIAQLGGRVLEYTAGKRVTIRIVGVAALTGLLLALLGLALAEGPAGLAAAVLLYGAANGVMTVVRGAMPSQVFGTAHFGAIAGALAMAGSLARAAGPLAIAWLWALSGSYRLPLLLLGALALVALGVFALATAPRRPAECGAGRRGAARECGSFVAECSIADAAGAGSLSCPAKAGIPMQSIETLSAAPRHGACHATLPRRDAKLPAGRHWLRGLSGRIAAAFARSAQRRELAELDARMLRDIGVTPYDRRREVSRWWWQ